MKMWIQRTKKIICTQKGETLMESVVSLFVFTLLMVAVAAMIQTSLKMTGIFTEEAKTAQEELNLVTMSDYANEEVANIMLTAPDIGVEAEHRVVFNTGGEVLAFAPEN